MTIYKVVFKGEIYGVSNINTLWYRLGAGIDVDGLTLSGADTLADLVKSQVWDNLKYVHVTDFTMKEIVVYPMHSGSFDLVYQNPYTKFVNEHGIATSAMDGTAICVNMKFNMEPTTIVNGVHPPKRGYIAVGPINSAWIGNGGQIDAAFLSDPANTLVVAASKLAENLESLLPPAIFYPIRVSQTKVLGIWKVLSYADVSSCTPRLLTSFRRSRMMEA